MAFVSGLDAVNQAIEEGRKRADSARQGSTGQSLNYFNWKPGDKKIIRFLSDDVITADFYDFILDRTGQTKNFMVDPDDPRRLQRYMSPSPGIGWKKDFKTGELVEPKARKMCVGVAVLRHEVPNPNGKGMIIEDLLVDKEVDGKNVPSRHFGIIQQSIPNFWHTFSASCYTRYGTICDRDYEVSREGSGFDTSYSVLPLTEDPALTDTDVVKSFYFYGDEWNGEDPQRFLKCPMTTKQWAEYFSGEERYKYWLTPEGGATEAPPLAPGTLFSAAPTQQLPPPADEAQAEVVRTTNTAFSSLQQTLLANAKTK